MPREARVYTSEQKTLDLEWTARAIRTFLNRVTCSSVIQPGGVWTRVLASSTGLWRRSEGSSLSVYGNRSHTPFPGREGKFQDRRSTDVCGNRWLKRRRGDFGGWRVHPDSSYLGHRRLDALVRKRKRNKTN